MKGVIRMIQQINVHEYDLNRLLDIWEASILATHNFINRDAIDEMKPSVITAFAAMDTVLIYEDHESVAGFMGIKDHKIEMLFLDPVYRKSGIGKQLIEEALQTYKIKYVDVNEQNLQAVGFYKHLGFKVISRSETDDEGRNYPILHMEHEL